MRAISGGTIGLEYRYMSEEEWWSEPWEVRAAELSVWVLECCAEPTGIERMLHDMRFDDAKQKGLFINEYRESKEYTYIALGLGEPVQAGATADGWRCTTERYHVTIGYAAWMPGSERKRLQEILVEVLENWRDLAPAERPMKLTRHRRAVVLTS